MWCPFLPDDPAASDNSSLSNEGSRMLAVTHDNQVSFCFLNLKKGKFQLLPYFISPSPGCDISMQAQIVSACTQSLFLRAGVNVLRH